MKTQNLLVALSVAMLFSTSVARAQRVEANLVDGYPVINCSDMPSSAYTTTAKGKTEAELKTEDANKTVYHRFAVYKSNSGKLSNWYNAFTFCAGIAPINTWRLPTQRELMLIWVLKSELESTSGFTAFSTFSRWSATESSDTSSAWFVSFSYGVTYQFIKTNSNIHVRCVRDI